MNIFRRYFMPLIICVAFAVNASAQQGNTLWTAKTAAKWAKSRVWSSGGDMKLHPSVDKVEFATQYEKNKDAWDKAFKFLNDKKLDTLSPGKYPIDGTNVYATITETPSKEFDQSAWESHRNYIDLQYVIKGKEKIGVSPVSSAKVIKPYDENKDVANYEAEGQYYIAVPGKFFLFFPTDAHRPNIKAEGYETAKVKKIVIKIKYIK